MADALGGGGPAELPPGRMFQTPRHLNWGEKHCPHPSCCDVWVLLLDTTVWHLDIWKGAAAMGRDSREEKVWWGGKASAEHRDTHCWQVFPTVQIFNGPKCRDTVAYILILSHKPPRPPTYFLGKNKNIKKNMSESLFKLSLLQEGVGGVGVCGGEDRRAVAPCRQQLSLSSAPAGSRVSSTLSIPSSSHSSH